MKKILVTGANGFIGSNLFSKLFILTDKFELHALSRNSNGPLDKLGKIHKVDFIDNKKVKEIIDNIKPNIVIHLACSKYRIMEGTNLLSDYFLNLNLSLNIIESVRNLPELEKFIFFGSCDEYGPQPEPYNETQSEHPLTYYGLYKLTITKKLIALNHVEKFPSIIIRPSVVYGPGQGEDMFLPSLAKAIISKKYFDMTFGDQYRDYIYIDDLIEAIVLLIYDRDLSGEVINITYGKSYQLNQIAKKLANLIKKNGECMLRMGKINYRKSEIMEYFTSNQKAKRVLSWSPKTNLDIGLKTYAQSLLI